MKGIRLKKTATPETAPKGKRSLRNSVHGNTNAYIGGKFWRCIGETYAPGVEAEAIMFMAGEVD